MIGQFHVPDSFKLPGTSCTGGCVDPTNGLEPMRREIFPCTVSVTEPRILRRSGCSLEAVHINLFVHTVLPISWSPTLFSGSGPVGLPAVPWTEKKQLKVRHFSSDVEIIAASETWLDGQLSEFLFLSSLQKLEQRAKKCIELRGVYVL